MPELDSIERRVAFLGDLADSLGHAIADNGGGMLIYVTASAPGYDVGVAPLDGHPPAHVLLGSVAPDHWAALGVAARGRVRPLGGAGDPPRIGRAAAAEVVVLVDRSGAIVSRVRHGHRVLTEVPAWGCTLDLLQRALGLPTAPPQVPTGELFAVTWLERVLSAGRSARSVPWPHIRALHPSFELLEGNGPSDPIDLVLAAKTLEKQCDWDRLRWLVIEGGWREPELTPADAAWLDVGGFSRWALGHHAPLPALVAGLAEAIGPASTRRCIRVLDCLGLGTAAQGGPGRALRGTPEPAPRPVFQA